MLQKKKQYFPTKKVKFFPKNPGNRLTAAESYAIL